MLPAQWPTSLPALHRCFLEHALPVLAADPRLVGVAAAGSFADDRMDLFSDVDLLLAVEPDALQAVLAERTQIAGSLGTLLAAFTGEHVCEPRLLICLYGPELLHVDLKFVALTDAALRVDNPVLLLDRDGRLASVLASSHGAYPHPNAQWIEDRFWVWVHYGACKIGRGELLEAIGFLAFLRSTVLGPLGQVARGLPATGLRRIEQLAPSLASELQSTLAGADQHALLAALHACVQVYVRLRGGPLVQLSAAEPVVLAYLDQLQAQIAG